MAKQPTYADLTDDVRARIETTRQAANDLRDAVSQLTQRGITAYDSERAALRDAAQAAQYIADRHAAIALEALRVVRV